MLTNEGRSNVVKALKQCLISLLLLFGNVSGFTLPKFPSYFLQLQSTLLDSCHIILKVPFPPAAGFKGPEKRRGLVWTMGPWSSTALCLLGPEVDLLMCEGQTKAPLWRRVTDSVRTQRFFSKWRIDVGRYRGAARRRWKWHVVRLRSSGRSASFITHRITGFMLRRLSFVEISSLWTLSATFALSEVWRYVRTTHLKFSDHYGLSLLFYLIL